MNFQPGWYDDGSGAQRWWNGKAWTEMLKPTISGPVLPPPGWYDDGSGTQRWWDGNAWTELPAQRDATNVQAGPRTQVDPIAQSDRASTGAVEPGPRPNPIAGRASPHLRLSSTSPALPVINFTSSKLKLALVSAGCGLFAAGGFFVLASGPAPSDAFWAVITILFFGVGGLWMLVKLRRVKAVLVLTPDGIHPVSGGLIPWADVEAVGTCRVSGTKLVGIRLSRYNSYIASLTPQQVSLALHTGKAARMFGVVAPLMGPDGAEALELAGMPRASEGIAGQLAWARHQADGYDLTFSPLLFDRRAARVVEEINGYRAAWATYPETDGPAA